MAQIPASLPCIQKMEIEFDSLVSNDPFSYCLLQALRNWTSRVKVDLSHFEDVSLSLFFTNNIFPSIKLIQMIIKLWIILLTCQSRSCIKTLIPGNAMYCAICDFVTGSEIEHAFSYLMNTQPMVFSFSEASPSLLHTFRNG